MIRILSTLQGVISFILVVVSSVLGWPIWVTIIGLLTPIAISLIIVFSLRGEETPKGRIREIIEAISGFVFGIGGVLFWTLSPAHPTMDSSTPWWFGLTALPSVVFNLGIYLAWVFWLLEKFFSFAQEAFEFFSGESVGLAEQTINRGEG